MKRILQFDLSRLKYQLDDCKEAIDRVDLIDQACLGDELRYCLATLEAACVEVRDLIKRSKV